MDYRLARILRVVIIVLVALVVIALLVAIFNFARRSLTSDDQPTTQSQQINLSDYQTNGSQMLYIASGKVQAPENQQTITIKISAAQRQLLITSNYGATVLSNTTLSNDQNSYNAFLGALTSAGFTTTAKAQTTRQSCPLGQSFSYQIASGGQLVQDTWNTSCANRQGTFGGNTSQVRQLFQLQIPNYSSIINSVN